jgi:hypothetical protein
MVVDKIIGQIRKYKIRGLPDILREIADGIEKPNNPHPAIYDAGDIKEVIQQFEKKTHSTIKYVSV